MESRHVEIRLRYALVHRACVLAPWQPARANECPACDLVVPGPPLRPPEMAPGLICAGFVHMARPLALLKTRLPYMAPCSPLFLAPVSLCSSKTCQPAFSSPSPCSDGPVLTASPHLSITYQPRAATSPRIGSDTRKPIAGATSSPAPLPLLCPPTSGAPVGCCRHAVDHVCYAWNPHVAEPDRSAQLPR